MEVLVHPTLHRDLGTVVLRLSGQHSQRSRPGALWGHVHCSPQEAERGRCFAEVHSNLQQSIRATLIFWKKVT